MRQAHAMTEEATPGTDSPTEQPFSAEAVATARLLASHFLESLTTDDMETAGFPRKLFHYTNMAGFKGIIESKSLWATDARYLNDSQELIYGEKVVSEQLSIAAGRYDDEDIKRLLDTTRRSYSKLEWGLSIFTTSFSESEDDLSQWRGYGSSLGGVALQMDMRPFSCNHCDGSMMKVVYDRTDQNRIIDGIIEQMIILYHRIKVHCSELLASIHCSIAFRAAVFPLILKFKSAYFSAEREWRLIKVHEDEGRIQNLQHRLSSGLLVPYLALQLKSKRHKEFDQLSIEGLKLGPTSNAQLALHSIAEFMRHHGYRLLDGFSISNVSLR